MKVVFRTAKSKKNQGKRKQKKEKSSKGSLSSTEDLALGPVKELRALLVEVSFHSPFSIYSLHLKR
jgi:hypothetical protein